MPVDNQLYDRLAGKSWSDDSVLSILRTSVNPPRVSYIRDVLVERMQLDPRGLRALDIGCGGGLLAEEVARLGAAAAGLRTQAMH